MQLSNGCDGVGLLWTFVLPVALVACKSQSITRGMVGARLHFVKCDLDNQLGANVNGRRVTLGLSRKNLFRLPGERLVCHFLIVFPIMMNSFEFAS